MTVKELIEHLKTFDENLEVAYKIHSDASRLEKNDINIIDLVDHGTGSYLEMNYRGHNYPKDKIKKFLLFPGN